MDRPAIDTDPFAAKHRRLPQTGRVALWEFRVDDDLVYLWGEWDEVTATIALYIRMNALESPSVALLDYSPMPKVFTVPHLDQ